MVRRQVRRNKQVIKEPEYIPEKLPVYEQIKNAALKAIEDVAERYEKNDRKVKLRHLSRDCHYLLTRTGQIMIDSEDDPEYALAVDYDVRIGILRK